MNVISFVSQKGGSGKSTLAISCAVAAYLDQKKVLIIDTDLQGTSENWFQRRELDNPILLKIESHQLKQALSSARKNGFDLVVIDTPGRDEPCIASVIQNSDFCLVPCRPTPADMKASPPTIAMIQRLSKPCAFILNQAPSRGARLKESASGLSILSNVCPIHINSRTAYQDSQGLGLGVLEYEPEGKAAGEIRELWQWIWKKMERLSNEKETNVA